MAESLFNSSRLYNVLKDQDLLPQRTKEKTERGGYSYSPDANLLHAPDERNKLTHEMTHAVDVNILESTASLLASKEGRTKQEQQFLNAYNKLNGKTYGIKRSDGNQRKPLKENQEKFVQSAYYNRLPEGYKPDSWDKYRTSAEELQGWGVGNTSVKGVDFNTPSSITHLDPTITTEFDILLSMYNSLPKEVKGASATARKNSLKSNEKRLKNAKKDRAENYEFSNIEEDPFKNLLLK